VPNGDLIYGIHEVYFGDDGHTACRTGKAEGLEGVVGAQQADAADDARKSSKVDVQRGLVFIESPFAIDPRYSADLRRK
jgi:hypothetical protein